MIDRTCETCSSRGKSTDNMDICRGSLPPWARISPDKDWCANHSGFNATAAGSSDDDLSGRVAKLEDSIQAGAMAHEVVKENLENLTRDVRKIEKASPAAGKKK